MFSLAKITPQFFSQEIKKEGNRQNFFAARRFFEQAKNERQADFLVYGDFIFAAGQCGEFDAAKTAFKEALDRELVNVHTYISYINAAKSCKCYQEIRQLFLDKNYWQAQDVPQSSNLYVALISALSFVDIPYAKIAYANAREHCLADIYVHNVYIDVMAKKGNFNEVLRVYREIKKSADKVTYTSVMSAINNFTIDSRKRFEMAQEIFADACACNQLSEELYSVFIKIATKARKFDVVRKLADEVYTQGLLDAVLYNNLIEAAGEEYGFNAALKKLQEAVDSNLINERSCTILVKFAFQSTDAYALAKILVVLKKIDKAESIEFYRAVIIYAFRYSCAQQAIEAFDTALSKNLVDSRTFATFINLLSKSKVASLQKIQNTFEAAKQRGLVNREVCLAFFDATYFPGRKNFSAELLFDNWKNIFLNFCRDRKIDLHGASAGSTRAVFRVLNGEFLPPGRYELVVGKNLHSQLQAGPVRAVVDRKFQSQVRKVRRYQLFPSSSNNGAYEVILDDSRKSNNLSNG